MLGEEIKKRFRPSFFPFTEPSLEMDILLNQIGNINKQWIEILGCGLIDPCVFQFVNLDPNVWSGYAFGIGIERTAMLLQGIDDIRYYYNNDWRFLKQFK